MGHLGRDDDYCLDPNTRHTTVYVELGLQKTHVGRPLILASSLDAENSDSSIALAFFLPPGFSSWEAFYTYSINTIVSFTG